MGSPALQSQLWLNTQFSNLYPQLSAVLLQARPTLICKHKYFLFFTQKYFSQQLSCSSPPPSAADKVVTSRKIPTIWKDRGWNGWNLNYDSLSGLIQIKYYHHTHTPTLFTINHINGLIIHYNLPFSINNGKYN